MLFRSVSRSALMDVDADLAENFDFSGARRVERGVIEKAIEQTVDPGLFARLQVSVVVRAIGFYPVCGVAFTRSTGIRVATVAVTPTITLVALVIGGRIGFAVVSVLSFRVTPPSDGIVGH